jgi:hypothetical protein
VQQLSLRGVYLSEFKNLKVPKDTHELLVLRAKSLGIKAYVLADTMLKIALEIGDAELQRRVAFEQQTTPQKENTKLAESPR